MKNKLSDLYNHLFETLETLKEADKETLDFEITRTNAVRLTANTLINAAKLEVDIRRINKNVSQSTFFEEQNPKKFIEDNKNQRPVEQLPPESLQH
jgi:antitoxin component of RelBE/YafQ-DinJ toxin-antitoxin module